MAIPRDDARKMLQRAGKSDREIAAALGETMLKSPKPSKYKNKRTYSDIIGRNFHSDAERRYGEFLWGRQEAGEIRDLAFQKRVKLLGAVTMIVDFYYFDNDLGDWVYDEYKGFETDKWRLQKKLWEQVGPGIYRVTRSQSNFTVIYPKPSDELIGIVLRHLAEEFA